MRVALKIDVASWRALRVGVPSLFKLLDRYAVKATFFFPLGVDDAGRRPLCAWRHRHRLGYSALLYGTLLPGRAMAADSRRLASEARAEGHEVGVIGYSPAAFAHRLAFAAPARVRADVARLHSACLEPPFDDAPPLAVAGWQTHPELVAALTPSRFRYSSMSRGRFPFYPMLQGRRSQVPELPTTLPSLGEVLAVDGVTSENAHAYLYAESRHILPMGHVYSASADHEGIDALAVFERLLVMWKGQGGDIQTMGARLAALDAARLPHHLLGWGAVDGSGRHLAMQSLAVPA
jgi:undecaprenyl phosphate-alpha-L-ara4FN deformylase